MRQRYFKSLGVILASLNLAACGGGGAGGTGTGVNLTSNPSFTISAGPSSASVVPGGSVTTTITVTGKNGFAGSVNLSASGLPSGVTASFNPAAATTSSILTLAADTTAALGTTALTVTGTSGSLKPTTSINLAVAAASVAVSLSPKRAAIVSTAGTVQFTPSVTGNVSDTRVTWSVDGIAGGNSSVGFVSNSGLYAAPATGGTHTVVAASTVLPSASASASVAVTDLAGVFHYHNDLSQDGINTQEYALTPALVNTATFGKLGSCKVDGAIYTQPLWVPRVSIGGGTHNVLIVATQHDSVYAFDADDPACPSYWKVNLLDTLHGGTPTEVPLPWRDVGKCLGDIYPELGVTATPVIDADTNIVYLISASESPGTTTGVCQQANGTFYHRLHALDLANGSEKTAFNSPVTIAASVPGNGSSGSGGMVSFNSQFEHSRSALSLANGRVYVAFGSHEDATPYHGWLFGYSASDLSQPPSIFNTTPNGGLGGIWGSGGSPAVDGTGDIYVTTGNGIFDANSMTVPFNDYGDSVMRLTPSAGPTLNGSDLNLAGWFTPFNQATLASGDKDLGSGGVLLLPDQTSGPPHLVVQLGKTGELYLMDRDNMGQFNPTDDSQIVQSFLAGKGVFGTPAFWNDALYIAGSKDFLQKFDFDPSTGLFSTTSSSASINTFPFPGATPSISSSGDSNGIVWALDTGMYGYANRAAAGCSAVPVPPACVGPAVLHAYDANNLMVELWNSTQASNKRDVAGNAVKFVVPTIANGKVYVSTATEIDVYGLLP